MRAARPFQPSTIRGQILNILTKIAIGITTGGNIIIGQYYGAKEQGRLGEASGTLLSLSLLLGAATAVGLYAGAYPLLGLLGAPAMEQSVAYLRICAVGMVFVFVLPAAVLIAGAVVVLLRRRR